MSEEEMIEEINRLKMEKGISLSNIDNMLLE